MMMYLFLCSAITVALKGNNSPVLPNYDDIFISWQCHQWCFEGK
jgi:hypothetical protein